MHCSQSQISFDASILLCLSVHLEDIFALISFLLYQENTTDKANCMARFREKCIRHMRKKFPTTPFTKLG